MAAGIISWDCREQPDIDHLDKAVREASGGNAAVTDA